MMFIALRALNTRSISTLTWKAQLVGCSPKSNNLHNANVHLLWKYRMPFQHREIHVVAPPDAPPPLDSTQELLNAIDQSRANRERSVKQGRKLENSKVLECYQINANGEHAYKTTSKLELIKATGLHARDLVVVDTGYHRRSQPTILVRDRAFVLALANIRAVVSHDHVLLLHPENPTVQEFAARLSAYIKGESPRFSPNGKESDSGLNGDFESTDRWRLKGTNITGSELPQHSLGLVGINPRQSLETDDTLSFECKVLEATLSTVCEQCDNRIMLLSPLVKGVLDSLNARAIDPEILHQLLPMKDALSQFEIEATLMRNVLNELLHNDEDMLEMLLSEKQKRQMLPPLEDHNQVEMLLENYVSRLVGVAQEAYYLRKRVESTQSIAELKLDAYRNYMLRVNAQLAMVSVALASGTVVAGFFGMNLQSGFETDPHMFYATMLGCGIGMGFIVTLLNRRIQRLMPRAGNDAFDSVFNHLDEIQHIVGLVGGSAKPTRITRDEFRRLIRQVQGTRISKDQVDLIYQTFSINSVEDRVSETIKSRLRLSESYSDLINVKHRTL